ncbi:T9SS type A sorting domain-containing protein [candidate division WOR-3 bacterium]|nr:T9SS type A sorting domain-containing protein [candidate division WOR-3 bacterium]
METRLLRQMHVLLVVLLVPQFAQALVDTAWVRRYDGPAHADDWAEAIAVDSQGNVYVTGVTETDTFNGHYDIITLKYGPNGELVWAKQYGSPGTLERPSAVAVDWQGSVYVTGYGNNTILTLKYSSAGQLLWSLPFGSEGGATDLALDALGNALLCGSVLRTADSLDMVTIKYRPNGDSAWVRLLDWAGGDEDARGLSVTPQGGPCVAAAGYDTRPGSTYLTVSYDSNGTRQWLAAYDGPADWDSPFDIAVDSAGCTLVTGSSEGTNTGWDYLTVRLDPAGETLWTRRYNGTANGSDNAYAVAACPRSDVVVTGRTRETSSLYDCTTVMYSGDGSTRWVARYDGPESNWDEGYGAALDSAFNVYVEGASYGTRTTRADFITLCYSGVTGETLWSRRYNSPHDGWDEGRALAVTASGIVCVTGSSGSPTGDKDILTIKYVQNGAVAEKVPLDAGLQRHVPEAAPNPFRARTAISFQIPTGSKADLLVFNAAGRLVKTLVDGVLPAGTHTAAWDGTDDDGQRVPAGVYTIRLTTEQTKQSLKVLVLD